MGFFNKRLLTPAVSYCSMYSVKHAGTAVAARQRRSFALVQPRRLKFPLPSLAGTLQCRVATLELRFGVFFCHNCSRSLHHRVHKLQHTYQIQRQEWRCPILLSATATRFQLSVRAEEIRASVLLTFGAEVVMYSIRRNRSRHMAEQAWRGRSSAFTSYPVSPNF